MLNETVKIVNRLWVIASLSLVSGLFAGSVALAQVYTTHKMDNGLTVLTLPNSKVPLVTLCLTFKAGGMTETPQTSGLTHLWEHMFFKGNARLPNQEAFSRRVRQLGISFNGDTDKETVRYYFTLPSAFLDEGLQFMADAISTPLIDQAELEKERIVVMDEYDRNASSPYFDLHNLSRRLIYGDQMYQRDALGQRAIVEKATRQQLIDIQKEVFVPANGLLAIGGDIDPTEAVNLTKKHFSGWQTPKDWQFPKRPDLPPFPDTTKLLLTNPHARNASAMVYFKGPTTRKDEADTFVADVLISLLGHKSGKFYKKFIDSGLAHDASLYYHTQGQAGSLTLHAESDPSKIVDIRNQLLAEAKEWLKPDYFSEEQLEDVRLQLAIGRKCELDDVSDYTKSLTFWWSVAGLDYYEKYIPSMQKVSLEDVRKFVKTYLHEQKYVSLILMSPEDAKKVGLQDTGMPLARKLLSEQYPHLKAKSTN